jgi:hypothetical protein
MIPAALEFAIFFVAGGVDCAFVAITAIDSVAQTQANPGATGAWAVPRRRVLTRSALSEITGRARPVRGVTEVFGTIFGRVRALAGGAFVWRFFALTLRVASAVLASAHVVARSACHDVIGARAGIADRIRALVAVIAVLRSIALDATPLAIADVVRVARSTRRLIVARFAFTGLRIARAIRGAVVLIVASVGVTRVALTHDLIT